MRSMAPWAQGRAGMERVNIGGGGGAGLRYASGGGDRPTPTGTGPPQQQINTHTTQHRTPHHSASHLPIMLHAVRASTLCSCCGSRMRIDGLRTWLLHLIHLHGNAMCCCSCSCWCCSSSCCCCELL